MGEIVIVFDYQYIHKVKTVTNKLWSGVNISSLITEWSLGGDPCHACPAAFERW